MMAQRVERVVVSVLHKQMLLPCKVCGGEPDFVSEENYSAHTFWRVVCRNCGCGTWCDEKGFGYEDNPGKLEAAEEWNREFGERGHE